MVKIKKVYFMVLLIFRKANLSNGTIYVYEGSHKMGLKKMMLIERL